MKRKAPAKVTFPLVLTERGVSTTIYRTKASKGGKEYVSYTLSWQTPEGRRRKVFGDFDDAKREAGAKLAGILSGRADSTLGLADAEFLTKARQEADRIGKPLFAILEEYADAQKILAGRTGILSAAKYWDTHVGKVKPILVDTAYGEFLAAKEKDGCSPSYLKDLRKRGRAFREAFVCHVHELDRTAIREWLEKASASAVDWNKRHGTVSAFLNWCSEKGYVAAEAAAEAVRLRRKDAAPSDIEIYTPVEMRLILNGNEETGPIREDILPFVVLGAFCGIRPDGEFQRLQWQDVNLAEKIVTVGAAQAKVAARRIVPLADNVVQWLAPYANHSGAVAPFGKMQQAFRRHVEKVGLRFKRNGLRHSFGSYRLAVVQSAAQVALEMGNSPKMVFAHYRQLVTEAQAKEFWSVAPVREGNVVPIAAGA